MTSHRKLAFVALNAATALSVFAIPAVASAQEASSAGVKGDDIVVTARRVEERLQDVPLAITAMSGKQLERQGIKSTEDLRYHVPSLQIAPSPFGSAVPGYTIRGQRQFEQLLSQDPSVGVYFADVVQVRSHGTNSSAYDLASVQVLKGPQGTLFGRNTTGGAVLFQPNKPTSELGGAIGIEAGNYNLWRATGIINLPLDEKFMVRLAGQFTRRDGYNYNLTLNTRTDDERTESARVSIRALPVDGVTNDFVFNYFHQDDAGNGLATGEVWPGSTTAAIPGALAALARQRARSIHIIENDWPSYAKINSWTISNTTAIELSSSVTLKNIFGYRHVKSDVAVDFDGLPVIAGETRNLMISDQISNELQLSGNTGNLSWVGGLYYFKESGDDTQYSLLIAPRVNDGGVKNVSYSAYLQGNYKLTDQLTATAGFRYTRDERTLEARSKLGAPGNVTSFAPQDLLCRLTDANNVRLNPCSKTVETSFKSPSWLLSLDYKVSDDALVYLSHRRGYRSGGWNLRSLAANSFIPFNPETVYDIEAGFKLDLADRRVRINGAIYKQWYNDIQRAVSQCIGNPCTTVSSILNAGKATIQGGELEVTLKPVDLIEIGGNLSVVDAKYIVFQDNLGDESGNKFAWAPKYQASGYFRVNLPLPEDQGDAGIQLGVYHQSEMQVNDFNSPRPLKAYTLLDLNANWNRVMGSPIDLGFFVKNLTDKEYAQSSINQLPSLPPVHGGLGWYGEMPGAPRTFGVSLRYHFGSGV